MPAWNARRAARARRRPDGTFKAWTGGRTKASLPKKQNNYQGIAAHIGAAFKRDHGRPARTGDLHRTRKADGSYHAQAWWYVKTPHGWRKSPHGTRRPTPAEVAAIIGAARPGRSSRRRKK